MTSTPTDSALPTTDSSYPAPAVAASPAITVYWRPGCGFCSRLFRQLDQAGISYEAMNIWDDPNAAATVRSLARGSETVPTVVVGGAGFVNPSVGEISAALGGS